MTDVGSKLIVLLLYFILLGKTVNLFSVAIILILFGTAFFL